MTYLLFFAIYYSLIGLSGIHFDYFAGSIPFRAIGISAIPVALFLTWKSIRRVAIRYRTDRWIFLVALVIFGFMLSPWFRDFTPVGRGWDGANHLALITRILEFQGHREIYSGQFNLIFGGSLWGYPWGFHSTIATLSSMTHISPIYLVYPIVVFLFTLAFIGLLLWGKKIQIPIAAMLIPIFYFLMFASGGHALLINNYWTQIVGIFLAIVLILSLQDVDVFPWPVIGLLMGGMLVTYPLYVLCLLPGFLLYMATSDRPQRWRLMAALAIGLLISAPLLLPTWDENWARFAKRGALIWKQGKTKSDWVLLIMIIASIPGLFRLSRKKLGSIQFFPIGVFLIMIFPLILGSRSYWIWKMALFGMVLLIPSMGVMIQWIFTRPILRDGQISNWGLLILGIGVLFALLLYPTMSPLWKLESALDSHDVQMRKKIAEFSDSRIAYVTSPRKIPWLEAVSSRPPIVSSLYVYQLTRRWLSRWPEELLLDDFIALAKPGDLVAIQHRTTAVIPPSMSLVDKIGPWEIYRWREKH